MHGKHDSNNTKNEKLERDMITCEEWRRKERDQRKKKQLGVWLEGQP